MGPVTSLAYSSQFSSHEKSDFYLFKKQTETPNKILDILNETWKKSSTIRRMSFLLLSELANSISLCLKFFIFLSIPYTSTVVTSFPPLPLTYSPILFLYRPWQIPSIAKYKQNAFQQKLYFHKEVQNTLVTMKKLLIVTETLLIVSETSTK